MDRGFLFGDGIYEVFPVYNKKIIGLDSHLNRLQDGLDVINIKNPHSKDEWINLINKVILAVERSYLCTQLLFAFL